jgi:hypothetical protein
LLANAVGQFKIQSLIHRIREQARSHIFIAFQMWERVVS